MSESLKIVSHNTMQSTFSIVVKEMIRIDIVWEVVKYIASYRSCIYFVVQFCIFFLFPYWLLKTATASLFTLVVIRNIIVICLIFVNSLSTKKSKVSERFKNDS